MARENLRKIVLAAGILGFIAACAGLLVLGHYERQWAGSPTSSDPTTGQIHPLAGKDVRPRYVDEAHIWGVEYGHYFLVSGVVVFFAAGVAYSLLFDRRPFQ